MAYVFDLGNPATNANPFPEFARLRAEDPVHWSPAMKAWIVTRYADCVQAASFVELNAIDAPPDPRKWERLEDHVVSLGLPIAGPYQRWMGARPTLPDYLPAIGRSRGVSNLLYAFGHQHLGLTLAPITARIVGTLARGETPPVDVTPFDIARFGRQRRIR